MAQAAIDTTQLPILEDGCAVVLLSKWYPECVLSMRDRCVQVLSEHGFTTVEEHTLPGTLEMPFAIQHLVQKHQQQLDVVICLSVVVKGDTDHFEVIRDTITQSFTRISLDEHIPIVNEILFVDDIADAEARTADNDANKGIEAAAAAIEIAHFARSNSI